MFLFHCLKILEESGISVGGSFASGTVKIKKQRLVRLIDGDFQTDRVVRFGFLLCVRDGKAETPGPLVGKEAAEVATSVKIPAEGGIV